MFKFAHLARWIPAIAWMLMIFILSGQPGGESGKLSKMVLDFLGSIGLDFRLWFGEDAMLMVRKLAHFTVFGILFLFFLWPLGRVQPWMKCALTALIYTFVFACSDELHQTFVPKRVGLITDVLIDTSGAVFCLLLVIAFRKVFKAKS